MVSLFLVDKDLPAGFPDCPGRNWPVATSLVGCGSEESSEDEVGFVLLDDFSGPEFWDEGLEVLDFLAFDDMIKRTHGQYGPPAPDYQC